MTTADSTTAPPPGSRASDWHDARPAGWQDVARQTAAAFVLLARVDSDVERTRLRERIILLNLPVATALARRYSLRGVPTDDLVQVACLGLVKAVDRFDVDREQDFLVFATPTITGEIKRHFRDCNWTVRPPRRLQELRTQVQRATQRLTHELGRAPTVRELAHTLHVTQDEVIETMTAGAGYDARSLEQLAETNEDVRIQAADTDAAGQDMAGATLNRLALQQLLADLPERERRLLALRFFANKSQSEIGRELGLSQMHVSRLLSASLLRLRDHLTGDLPAHPVTRTRRRPAPTAAGVTADSD